MLFGHAAAKECKMVIIMMGAPGAGKGTQAMRLSELLSLPHISTGDLFRENFKKETEIGHEARKHIDKGHLVPDDIVIKMLIERVAGEDCQRGYILDGFPRTLSQAEALERYLGEDRVIVVSIEVADEEVVARITGRSSCESCGQLYHKLYQPPKVTAVCDICGGKLVVRSDDTEETVRERLRVYHKQTAPVKEYYRERGFLREVEGCGTPSDIYKRVVEVMQ